jgi:glycosyltransferase involved in cell wall biosynthesis
MTVAHLPYMRVSVVLCTYSLDRYPEFQEAANSVLEQTYDDVELVVIVDGKEEVYDEIAADYGDIDNTQVHCNDRNRGLSYSRNRGAELATGDVVAFLDDDAVADSEWIAALVDGYERHDVHSVGGKLVPDWLDGEATHLPAEFYFLIGATYRGFPNSEGYVRNTFSSNLSFRRDTFLELGGFEEDMGKRGENNLQGGETQLCSRLHETTGERVLYVPDAVVEHKIYSYRTDRTWLLERSFWQGYSKRRMEEQDPGSTGTERAFVQTLLCTFLPQRIGTLVRNPSVERADQLLMLVALTGAAGVGYAWALANDIAR